MRRVELPGVNESVGYPSDAVDCDFSLVDGSVRGVPEPNLVQAITGTPRGIYYYKDRWYIVQGDKLYSLQGATLTPLASGITGSDKAHYVPLYDHLVIRVADRIYTVVGNTATQVSLASPPPAPSTERVYYVWNLNVDNGGSATYTSGTTDFTLQDVADSEPGAHRYLGSTDLANAPKLVRDVILQLESWYDTFSLRSPIVVQLWNNVNNPALRQPVDGAVVEIPYPYQVGTHTIRGIWELMPTTGVRFHIRHSTTWARKVTCRNVITPTHYALTTVSGGAESLPRYIEVSTSNSSGSATEFWFTKFTGLPTGTWRLYRRDLAGVYRLVHEGTNSSYTDYKLDSELGARLIVSEPPTSGNYAIEWQGRAVIATQNRLYISEVGRYRFGEDSEVVEVQDEIIGLGVMRGVLYYATHRGWHALIGWKDTLSTQTVHAEPCAVGYVGEGLGLVGGGVLIVGSGLDRRIRQTILKSTDHGIRKYWLTASGTLYIWYQEQNKWTRLSQQVGDYHYHAGVLFIQTTSGLYALSGIRSAFQLTTTLPIDAPSTLYESRLEGEGVATYEVQNRDGVWRSVAGDLPLRMDRVENRYYELPLRISGGKASVVKRLLMRLEPRAQEERR